MLFRFIQFILHHSLIVCIDLLILLMDEAMKLISSANSKSALSFFNSSLRLNIKSFKNKVNNTGDMIEPYGTPFYTFIIFFPSIDNL